MGHLRGLGHVLIASLLSLAVCALLSYGALVIAGVSSSWPAENWTAALIIPAMTVLWGLVIAIPIIVVLAAPAYALLLRKGRASFVAAAAIGVLPGLCMLPFSQMLGMPSMAIGLAVGSATHWLCGVSPNNSFKPKPLRGSA